MNRRRSFTLVEVLVALTVFALAAGSVYTSVHVALRMFRQQEGREEALTTGLLALEHVGQALKNSYANPDNDRITFSGTRERVDFFCLSAAGEVERRTWYLTPQASAGGYVLTQTRQSYRAMLDEILPEPERIHSQVAAYSLRYYSADEERWHEEWLESQRLPRLVRVDLTVQAAGKQASAVRLVQYVPLMATRELSVASPDDLAASDVRR